MKKQIFHDAATGVLIGLILSIIFSLIYAPNTYAPLSPESLVGQVMTQHQIHGALVLLYCTLIWAAIGILFNFGKRLFSRDWSLLRATLTHFFLMLVGFIPLATLAGDRKRQVGSPSTGFSISNSLLSLRLSTSSFGLFPIKERLKK